MIIETPAERRERHAIIAWAVLGGAILVYDALAPEGQMLSEAVDRGLMRHPTLTRLAVAFVAAHLLNGIREDFDPLHMAAVVARKRRRVTTLHGLPPKSLYGAIRRHYGAAEL